MEVMIMHLYQTIVIFSSVRIIIQFQFGLKLMRLDLHSRYFVNEVAMETMRSRLIALGDYQFGLLSAFLDPRSYR